MKNMKFGLFALLITLFAWQSAYANDDEFTRGELDQMLAPIALYPDIVLTHILVASTYPLEVIEADRWVKKHDSRGGQSAVDAVSRKDWDPSVKALVAFPDLLDRMSQDLDWLQDLGEAFLADEGRVLDRVQDLRAQAYAAGTFNDMDHMRVVRESNAIYIEPVRERVVYIPYYDPFIVYGGWHWNSYQPVIWRPHRHYISSTRFYWGPSYSISTGFRLGAIAWPTRTVVFANVDWRPRHFRAREIVRHRHSKRWNYDPYHRRHVAYRYSRAHKRYSGGYDNRRSLRKSLERKGISTKRKFADDDRQSRKYSTSERKFERNERQQRDYKRKDFDRKNHERNVDRRPSESKKWVRKEREQNNFERKNSERKFTSEKRNESKRISNSKFQMDKRNENRSTKKDFNKQKQDRAREVQARLREKSNSNQQSRPKAESRRTETKAPKRDFVKNTQRESKKSNYKAQPSAREVRTSKTYREPKPKESSNESKSTSYSYKQKSKDESRKSSYKERKSFSDRGDRKRVERDRNGGKRFSER